MIDQQVLQDVEEARLMVVTWRRDKVERQIKKAAVTLRRMRRSRFCRKLVSALNKIDFRREIDNQIEESRVFVRSTYVEGETHAIAYLRKIKQASSAREAREIYEYSKDKANAATTAEGH